MSLTPQRPFIPSAATRGASSRATPGAPFHLAPPFLHGQAMLSSDAQEILRPIEDYLDAGSRGAETEVETSAFDYSRASVAVADDLPPIEHFTDPLPIVNGFAPDTPIPPLETTPFYENQESVPSNAGDQSQALAEDESGWVETGWQQFDWNAAAALGDVSDPAASDEWSRTDWESAPPARETRETAAQAIASALDQIAERIRKGELVVPPPAAVADPAAIAATLAALLGVRH